MPVAKPRQHGLSPMTSTPHHHFAESGAQAHPCSIPVPSHATQPRPSPKRCLSGVFPHDTGLKPERALLIIRSRQRPSVLVPRPTASAVDRNVSKWVVERIASIWLMELTVSGHSAVVEIHLGPQHVSLRLFT